MSVDADTVRRIAHLARIKVAEDEIEHLKGELNAILAFVEQLSEVNVDGVEPMTSVMPMVMKKRHDVVTAGDDAAARATGVEARLAIDAVTGLISLVERRFAGIVRLRLRSDAPELLIDGRPFLDVAAALSEAARAWR